MVPLKIDAFPQIHHTGFHSKSVRVQWQTGLRPLTVNWVNGSYNSKIWSAAEQSIKTIEGSVAKKA